MAIKFFDCKGFGQFEPNQVWFNRAGMSESQCHLDPEEFAANFPMTAQEAAQGRIYAENGAFLMIDKVNRLAKIPTSEMSKKGFKMGVNYSTERIYNQYTLGRRNYCMIAGEYLPRIGFVEPGMRYTTNAVAWDEDDGYFTPVTTSPLDESTQLYQKVKADLANPTADPVYAFVKDGSDGKLVIGAKVEDAIGNVYAQVVKAYTNADGTLAFKFMFIDKPEA